MTAAATTGNQRCPLFITADQATTRRLTELATAAGTDRWLAADLAAAERFWSRASMVVIGSDAARSCSNAGLTTRDNVIVLTGDDLPCEQAWALALAIGAAQVASLPEADAFLVSRMIPQTDRRSRAPVLALTGARGGSGTSTLAAAVSLTAARTGRRTLLIDADAYGGGLDLVLGWEAADGLRWPDLAGMSGPFDPAKLRDGLPGDGGLTLLSHSRSGPTSTPSDRLAAVIDAGRQGHDLVILDLPRPGVHTLPRLVGDDHLLGVVVPAEVRAVAAARHVIAGYAGLADQAALVVRMPSPGKLSAEQISYTVGAPVVGSIATDAKLAGATESGGLGNRVRRGELAASAQALLATLAGPTTKTAVAS